MAGVDEHEMASHPSCCTIPLVHDEGNVTYYILQVPPPPLEGPVALSFQK
jgi:hypothetical protein